MRLAVPWQIVALRLAYDFCKAASDPNGPVGAMYTKTFMEEFCYTMLHASHWVRAQEKIYGVVATRFPAFHRGVAMLQSERGRQMVLRWLGDPPTPQGNGQQISAQRI